MLLIHPLAFWLIVCLLAGQSVAQTAPKTFTGEYYLTDVREVGSSLKLNADFTFDFFFSYGALDRAGHGSWKKQGNKLVLNSRTRPPKDFALVTSKTIPGNSITIRIVDPNQQLLNYIACAVRTGTDTVRDVTRADGYVHLATPSAESISLLFELCPDRYSVFPIATKAHNYFEFRFEPWISEVFFDKAFYTIANGSLEGPHPLLEPGKTYAFKRE